MSKYKLTSESVRIFNVMLYRIRALFSFKGVSAGDLGGWVQSESNLSQVGHVLLYDNAMVYRNAKVYGHALIGDNALAYGDARINYPRTELTDILFNNQ